MRLVLFWGLGIAAVPTVLAAGVPTFTVTVASAFLRNEPGAQSPATYSVFQGQAFTIIGRNSNNTWFQLDFPKATKGTWILASLGKVTGDLSSVPVINASATAAAATNVPAASAGALPTPTTSAGPSEICVLLYNDINGDGRLDANEGAITGGQLTILDTNTGAVVQADATTARDTRGHCFKDVPAGSYTIAAAPPAGYNATTEASLLLQAKAGEHYEITFGAQPRAGAAAASGKSSFSVAVTLGVVFFLLTAGIVAALILRRK